MRSNIVPLFAVNMLINGNQTVFSGINSMVTLKAPQELLEQLFELCDGRNTINDILEKLKKDWKLGTLNALLDDLFSEGVLVDSFNLHSSFWQAVKNPQHYAPSLSSEDVAVLVERSWELITSESGDRSITISDSNVHQILRMRGSVREFSGESVSEQNLINILWSMYGEISNRHRTVPSAGALYPLKLHLVLFERTENLSAGVYAVYLDDAASVGLTKLSDDYNAFQRSYVNPSSLQGSNGAIVISGSFFMSGAKYGNRSMLYVPLEAGHAAQNGLLCAAELSVATLEMGGFREADTAEAIHLPQNFTPLTTILFGQAAELSTVEQPNLILKDWAIPLAGSYKVPFAIAQAKVDHDWFESWSYGRDASPEIALKKAISEAREWASAGCVPEGLLLARFNELHSVVHPESILSFDPKHYKLKNFPFRPFSTRQGLVHEWVEVESMVSENHSYVLADQVYFPYYTENPPLHGYSNSSGCAAHVTKEQAIESSGLELIERDSFMNAYLGQLTTPTITVRSLPESIQKRVKALNDHGFRVWFKDHTLDLAPVVFVMVQSLELHFTSCASCCHFNSEVAASHALMEVEASVLARIQHGTPDAMIPSAVVMPRDHGLVYEQPRYYRKANFLVDGGRTTRLVTVGKNVAKSWVEFLALLRRNNLQLWTTPLTLSDQFGGNDGLYIYRSFIPGLVPMTFGYHMEPSGNQRIYELAKKYGKKNISYDDLTLFPHPFS